MLEGVLDRELSLVEKVLEVVHPKFRGNIEELYYVCSGGEYDRSNKIMYRLNEEGEYSVILY